MGTFAKCKFLNTPKGARASAIIYSIIETAKENLLKPYEYLIYLFENYPMLIRVMLLLLTVCCPGLIPCPNTVECLTRIILQMIPDVQVWGI